MGLIKELLLAFSNFSFFYDGNPLVGGGWGVLPRDNFNQIFFIWWGNYGGWKEERKSNPETAKEGEIDIRSRR